jgi:hypothetical protein
MKYSSFAIALLLNVTYGHQLIADPEDAKDAPAEGGPPHHEGGPPPQHQHHHHHNGPHQHHGPPRQVRQPPHHHHVRTHKSTIELEKEDKDTEKTMKAEKIKKMKAAAKEDDAPKPLDNNPILEAIQAGDALEKK